MVKSSCTESSLGAYYTISDSFTKSNSPSLIPIVALKAWKCWKMRLFMCMMCCVTPTSELLVPLGLAVALDGAPSWA